MESVIYSIFNSSYFLIKASFELLNAQDNSKNL